MKSAAHDFIRLETWQKYAVAFLLLTGVFTRLWLVGEKAFHHDESIHCYYSYEIAKEGRFKGPKNDQVTFGYDPVYHGPFLYHFGGLIFFLFGDSDFTARLPFALAGIFLLWLVWETRRLVGVPMALGMLAAAVLSPLVNYYSRFARNDVYIGTAFFAVAVYAALYLKEKRSGYLVASAFFLALGYSIKENSYIYGFCLGFFAVGWSVVRLILYGKPEFRRWFTQHYPLVVLLVLYACFSFFVFLFVAVDYRVDPEEHGFVGGLVDIASNAFVSEKRSLSGPELRKKIQSQTRFFTDKKRTFAKKIYILVAVSLSVLVLALLELTRHLVCRSGEKQARTGTAERGPPEPERFFSTGNKTLWVLISAILLFGSALLLSAFGIVPFLLAAAAWVVFEILRRDRLRLEEDSPEAPRILRITAPWLVVGGSVLLVALVYVFLFSQMFADPAGLTRGIYSYIEYWFGHQLGEYRLWGPWWFYLARLIIYEYLFLLVAGFGLLAAFIWCALQGVRLGFSVAGLKEWRGPFHPFFVLIFWLALFNISIYCVLHEKTPWLTFHQALPLALLAGGLIGWGLDTFRTRWFRVFLAFSVVPLTALTVKTHIQLNFIGPDNVNELVSQQQADRDIRDMVKMVNRLAAETGLYEDFPIASEDEVEWPFPWYFRHYKNYRVKTADPNAMVQFGDDSTFKEMQAKLGDRFTWRKYLHRGAWIENSMGDADLPGGTSLSKNIMAYLRDETFKGKSFRWLFWNYFFHRERWSNINPKWGYAYFRKDLLPTLESVEFPAGTLDPPSSVVPEVRFVQPKGSEKRFRLPRGLRFDSEGNLHVVDSLNGRVVVMDPSGNFVREYGRPGSGRGQLKVEGATWGPSDVALDKEGNCYVADTWNHRIVKFAPDGGFLLAWGSGGEGTVRTTKFFGPRGIEVGPDGLIYVADTGECEIEVFNPDGSRVKTIGRRGLKKGQFDEPVGIRFGPDGNLYVADTGNERIQVFTPEGKPKTDWLVPGWSFDKVGMEPSIGFLPDGRVVVTLSRKNMFRVYAKNRKSARNYSIRAGKTQPIGVAVGPNGGLWFSDRTTNQVFRLSLSKQ